MKREKEGKGERNMKSCPSSSRKNVKEMRRNTERKEKREQRDSR